MPLHQGYVYAVGLLSQNSHEAHAVDEQGILVDIGQFSAGTQGGDDCPPEYMPPRPSSRGGGRLGTQPPDIMEEGGASVMRADIQSDMTG